MHDKLDMLVGLPVPARYEAYRCRNRGYSNRTYSVSDEALYLHISIYLCNSYHRLLETPSFPKSGTKQKLHNSPTKINRKVLCNIYNCIYWERLWPVPTRYLILFGVHFPIPQCVLFKNIAEAEILLSYIFPLSKNFAGFWKAEIWPSLRLKLNNRTASGCSILSVAKGWAQSGEGLLTVVRVPRPYMRARQDLASVFFPRASKWINIQVDDRSHSLPYGSISFSVYKLTSNTSAKQYNIFQKVSCICENPIKKMQVAANNFEADCVGILYTTTTKWMRVPW